MILTEQEKLELEEKEESNNIEETALEEAEKPVKNKFWIGMLAGVLVTVFGCLLVVGVASGIWLMAGKVNSSKKAQMQSAQAAGEEQEADAEHATQELNMEEIGLKLNYIQDLIDAYYLFNGEKEGEDPVEWIYGGSAGIGGGYKISCGNIVIEGGTITASGYTGGAAIGSGNKGSRCGNITIKGGTITANAGTFAAGIGSGWGSSCGDITITNGVTSVTATKGYNSPNSIGAGYQGSCGTVTIGGNVGAISQSPYTYKP